MRRRRLRHGARVLQRELRHLRRPRRRLHAGGLRVSRPKVRIMPSQFRDDSLRRDGEFARLMRICAWHEIRVRVSNVNGSDA